MEGEQAEEGATRQAHNPAAGNGGTVPPHEHRFKPGQSGNPGGISRAQIVTREVAKILKADRREEARKLARSIVDRAHDDPATLRILLDRVEGPVEQRVHNTGDAGPAVIIEIVDSHAPDSEPEPPAST